MKSGSGRCRNFFFSAGALLRASSALAAPGWCFLGISYDGKNGPVQLLGLFPQALAFPQSSSFSDRSRAAEILSFRNLRA